MKRKIALFTLVLVAWPVVSFAGWPDVDIELSTCQPDGPVAKISQSWDPLKFWAKQTVVLEMALEEKDLKHFIEHCKIEYRDDRTELLECYQFYKNRHNSMLKCLKHAKKMCRHHGGRCY